MDKMLYSPDSSKSREHASRHVFADENVWNRKCFSPGSFLPNKTDSHPRLEEFRREDIM